MPSPTRTCPYEKLSETLEREKLRAHERMRGYSLAIEDPAVAMLQVSARDSLETLLRNAEEDFECIMHLIKAIRDKKAKESLQQHAAAAPAGDQPRNWAESLPSKAHTSHGGNKSSIVGAVAGPEGDSGVVLKSEQCKQRAKFSIAGEDEGDEDSLNFSAKRSTAQTSAMDDDDDLESFNPLEEGELKFSKNLEPENEEERREVEDYVPSRLMGPTSTSSSSSGRFTSTPAVIGARSEESSSATLARSMPVTVPVPEKVIEEPQLPPEVDKEDAANPDDIHNNIQLIAKSLATEALGELPRPPKQFFDRAD